MPLDLSPATRSAGLWAAVFATLFSIAYDVAQLAEWFGWLGSGGGAHNPSTAFALVLLLTPSLLLGPSFLVLMIAMHQTTPPARKVWSQSAVAFATVYAVLTGLTYFVQLTWVAPRLSTGRVQGMEPFLFTPFDSFLYAVDILGYSFMSLASLSAAMALVAEDRLERRARLFLFATGLLLPFIALQMFAHSLIWVAALWAVTFPAATWSLALLFWRAPGSAESDSRRVHRDYVLYAEHVVARPHAERAV